MNLRLAGRPESFMDHAPTHGQAPPALTVFTSDKAPLGKRFSLADGEIRKESFATLYAGTAETRQAATARELAALLEGLSSRQALASGVLIDGERARIGTRAKAGRGERLRSLADFAFPRTPGWLLWDYDAKTMPPHVAARVDALGGPVRALFHIWPEAEPGPCVIRPSSSDGVTAPGCEAIRSAGLHGFFLIEDVSQSRAVLDTLQERAWAAGLAWCALSKSGAVLIRSIVDVAVGSPERLIFEAPPILEPPVTRHPRATIVRDAPTPLPIPGTPLEVAVRATRQEASARLAIKPEAERTEEAFVEDRAQADAQRTGKPLSKARASIRQMMRGAVLDDDHLLQLGDGGWMRVGDILDAADRWDRRSIPDPIEGLNYGRDKATLLLRPRPGRAEEKPALVSHAHGQRTVYRFARYHGEPKPTPFHPQPKGDRGEALRQHPAAIERFFREVFEMSASADTSKDRQTAPRVMIGGAQGVGKTRSTIRQILLTRGMTILVLTTGHAKCAELVEDLAKEAAATSDPAPAVLQLKGRGASEGPEGMTMCLNPKAAAALGERGLSVPKTLCTRCPFQSDCGYLAQEARLKRLAEDGGDVVIVAPTDYAFVPLPGDVRPDLVIFDEAERNLGYLSAAISFDALGEPLAYDGPARRKGKDADSAEAADAFAVLLADVRPVRIAIRDAFQTDPATALGTLRRKGVDADRLRRVLDALHDFEDRTIGDRLSREISAHTFAARDGRALNLDKRLLAAVEGHHDKGLRAFRRICEALLLEMAHGRDEPVAVLRSDNVNPPRLAVAPPRQGVIAHVLREPYFGRELPFLHLDGTGDHRMAEQLFGPLQLEWHPVERPAHVVQVIGRNFSRQSITGINSRGEPIPSRQAEATQLRGDLVAYCHAHPAALVVATKRVVGSLKDAGLRNPTAHYGALRGRNAWEGLGSVILIGREQPSPAAVEAIARAYAARAGDLFDSLDGASWPTEPRGLRMRDGTVTPLEVETHPDPWASRVLAQIREGEALQAVDRVRPHFKEADPVRVHLLSPIVLDVTVDRVVPWATAKQGGSKVERALARRVLPLSESEAVRVHPDLWPNRKAVQRDREFQDIRAQIEAHVCLGHFAKNNNSLENVPSKAPTVEGTYLRLASAGRGGSRTVFRALILATTREAEDVLESVVGPVVDFRIETYSPDAGPRLAPAAVRPTLPEGIRVLRTPAPALISRAEAPLPRAVGGDT